MLLSRLRHSIGHATMDKLSTSSRSIASEPCFQHLPHEVLQQVLSYLPIKGARNVFKLLSRDYRVNTDYLRVAGLVQARIRDKVKIESQQQAESRLASLVGDCMNGAFPVALRSALIMELGGTLSQLPATLHAEALRFFLSQCGTIGEHAGPVARHKCMLQSIHAYQRRTELEPQLQKFMSVNDEEATIAADYFIADIDHGTVPLMQVIHHLAGLLAAMDGADAMNDSEQGDRAIAMMCEHCTDLFAVLDSDAVMLRNKAGWEQIAVLKARFAEKATLLFPARSMSCQAALVSVVLDLSGQGSAMRRQAEKDGRSLIARTPDAMLLENLAPLARTLFRRGVINTLIKRVEAWPEPGVKLGMLRQLAVVAWERGAMDHMERLCESICKLAPPDPVAMQALMQENSHKDGFSRMEIGTRDILPYLLCVPTGLPRVAAIEALGIFLLVLPEPKQSKKLQSRLLALCAYAVRAQAILMGRYYASNEPELERIADAAKAATIRPAMGGAASSTASPRTNPAYEAAMRMLEQHRQQNTKRGD